MHSLPDRVAVRRRQNLVVASTCALYCSVDMLGLLRPAWASLSP